MAAPQFVPRSPTHRPRSYSSPPWRDRQWTPDRPGDFGGAGQPDRDAGRMGSPGPDQGYILTLLPLLRDQVHLAEGEKLADAERGAAAVGLKRASLFSRAPILHDLKAGYVIWGFFDTDPPADLVTRRRQLFENIHHTLPHYPELRAVADAVPVESLARPLSEIEAAHRADWRAQLAL